MAITAPSTGRKMETPGGITKAINTPVSTALPSMMLTGRFSAFWLTYSTATQLITETAVMIRVWTPKIKTDRNSGGIRQATTVHMILATVSLLFTWGDTETIQSRCGNDWLSGACMSLTILLKQIYLLPC